MFLWGTYQRNGSNNRNDGVLVKCRKQEEKIVQFLFIGQRWLEAAGSNENPGQGTGCQFTMLIMFQSFLIEDDTM